MSTASPSYLASFPGAFFVEWGRVTQTMTDKSVACVFVPGSSPMYGEHDPDPDHPGKCFCQSYLYHDTPEANKRESGYLMAESELQLGEAAPESGDKVEVKLLMPSGEEKWWMCMVVSADRTHIGIQPPGYSMDEFDEQEGFEKVEQGDTGGRVTSTFFQLSKDSARLNTSRKRKTAIQVGQAPCGPGSAQNHSQHEALQMTPLNVKVY